LKGFFAKLTRRRLKNGVFHSVVDLQAAINRFVKEHNQESKPFIWKADPDEIIAAVKRGTKCWNQSIRVGANPIAIESDMGLLGVEKSPTGILD